MCVYRVDVRRRKLSDTFCHNYRLVPKTIRPTNPPQQMDLLIHFPQLFLAFFQINYHEKGNFLKPYFFTFFNGSLFSGLAP